MSLIVAKLGGSLAEKPQREAWLDALAASTRPLILVPGGGPFAQAVRAAQSRMGFDDGAAHRMALLAMEQFGAIIEAHSRRFVAASSLREIKAAIAAESIPVWRPSELALAAADIPASWDATSDSLAAWLAGLVVASQIVLIKSCDVNPPVSLGELAAQGVVDPLFPRFAAESGALVSIAGPAALRGAKTIFSGGGAPGVEVAVEAPSFPNADARRVRHGAAS